MFEYDIPIDTVYRWGPYLHSVGENYARATTAFSSVQQDQIKQLTSTLKGKLSAIKAEEQKFYNLFGVSNALEFSNTFLWGNTTQVDTPESTSQKILSILNTPEVFAMLTTLKDDERENIANTLENTAQNFLDLNSEFIQAGAAMASNSAMETIFNALNSMKGGKDIKIKVSKNGKIKETTVDLPKRQLTSQNSKYIMDILTKINPDIKKLRRGNIDYRISQVIQYFRDKGRTLLGDEVEDYAILLENKLKAAAEPRNEDNFLDESNISMFTNFYGAEGAILELVLSMSLQPSSTFESQKRTQNVLLANAVVTDYRRQYGLSQGGRVYTVKTKNKQRAWKITYKSPTDLLIIDPDTKTQYPIQLKNTLKNVGLDTGLSLQNQIVLPTFLANISNITSSEINNLLIYHIVNQATFPGGEGLAYINNILNACIEYYVESKYIERVAMPAVDALDVKIDTNMGNMFMIYSGTLIPISAFIEMAIKKIEENDTLILSDAELIEYGLKYSLDEIQKQDFAGRIKMGRAIYHNAKVTQIQIAIGQIVNYINELGI